MTEPSQYFKGRTVQEQMNEVIGYVDTRAAEVATTAIASDVAQVHQDMLDADADASAAAASAAAAAGTLANAVQKTGEASQSIAGDIAVAGNLSGGTVTVPTPVNNTDAANKKYVDDQDALNVQLTGSQAITGTKTVPLEATGTFSNQIASSNKLKNEMDNYALVVRTVGNQTIGGNKTFSSTINGKAYVTSGIPYKTTSQWYEILKFTNSGFVDIDYIISQKNFGVDNLFQGKVNIQIGISTAYPNKSKIMYSAKTVTGAISGIDLTTGLVLAKDSNGVYHVYLNHASFRYGRTYLNYAQNLDSVTVNDIDMTVTETTQPSPGDYDLYVTAEAIQ